MTRCAMCGGPANAEYCLACIKRVRDRARCLHCQSLVIVVITTDEDGISNPEISAEVRHDANCPIWHSRNGP